MATTLYLNDGSCVHTYDTDTESKIATFTEIVYDFLGLDCADFFDEILLEIRHANDSREDWEDEADEWRNMLVSVGNELKEALDKPRLDRKSIEAIWKDIYANT